MLLEQEQTRSAVSAAKGLADTAKAISSIEQEEAGA